LPRIEEHRVPSYESTIETQASAVKPVVKSSAALAGSPELDALKKECDAAFLAKCRDALQPFAKQPLRPAGMCAILGTAEAVSFAAAAGKLDPADAQNEIYDAIVRIARRT